MRPLIVDWLARVIGFPLADLLAPTYFTMAALATIVGAWLALRQARRDGDDVRAFLTAVAWGYLAAIVCGILAPIIADLIGQMLDGHVPQLRWAGMVAYGGFAGGFLVAAWSLRRSGTLTFARFADLAAAPIGIAIAFVRLGCFIAGCDYGKISSLPWALRFPSGSPAFADQVAAGLVPATRDWSLPVQPTQLYEAALGVLIYFAIRALGRPRRDGLLFVGSAALYAAGRAVIEVWRGDVSRGFFGPLSTSQLIGLVVLAGCAVVLMRTPRLAAAALLALLVTQSARADEETGFDVSGGIGATSALNRRNGQVPQMLTLDALATFTVAAPWGIGLTYESSTNSVAIHSTIAGVLSVRPPLAKHLEGLVLIGLGGTSVNFRDASFSDVVAFDFRISGGVAYNITQSWAITLTPIAFDFVQADALGGTIASYQATLGLAYGTRHSEPSAPPSPQQQPPPPPPPPTTPPTPQPYY